MTSLRVSPLLISLAFGLSACASTTPKTLPAYEAKLDSWIGQPVDKLVAAWGVPSSHWTHEDGTRTLRYETHTTKRVAESIGPVLDYPAFVPGDCVTIFGVSPKGTVRSWEYEGNSC